MQRRGHLDHLSRIREQVDLLFEQALIGSGYREPGEGVPGTWRPAVDVLETAEAFQLRAELAGLKRDDIELTVRDRRLEISGRRDPREGQLVYHRMERLYGPFHWSAELDAEVDADRVSAVFERGVLTVTLPKRSPGAGRVTVTTED